MRSLHLKTHAILHSKQQFESQLPLWKSNISSYRVIILIKPQLIVHYITRCTRCLSIGKHIFPVTDTPILIDIPVRKTYFLSVLLVTQGFPTTHRQPTHGLYPLLTSMGRCPEQRGSVWWTVIGLTVTFATTRYIHLLGWNSDREVEEKKTMMELVNGQKLSDRGLGSPVFYINEE